MAPPRILIIDDQEEVRDAFSRALALDGYATRAAESADSGMQAVEAMEPDAILLDLMMPMVNGLGFLRRLRETHRRTPVVVITAAGKEMRRRMWTVYGPAIQNVIGRHLPAKKIETLDALLGVLIDKSKAP